MAPAEGEKMEAMATVSKRRDPRQVFDDYVARPPGMWRKAGMVVVAILLPLYVWEVRGAVVGAVAFNVFGVMLVTTFKHKRALAWSRRHPALDASFFVPLTFIASAVNTTLALWWCVLVALGAGALLVTVGAWRRGHRRAVEPRKRTAGGLPAGSETPPREPSSL